MKLHLASAENNHLITGYDDGRIRINQTAYEHNLIVMPQQLILNWQATTFEELNHTHFEEITELAPEVVLLGTGKMHRFLHPQHYLPLTKHQIALECMTTAAACRTYNILMSEGRNVAAMLILK